MTRRKWFRMYHGLAGDVTLAVTAQQADIRRGDMIALWLSLLDHASRHTTPGSIEGFAIDETAFMLGLTPDMVTTALTALRHKKKIDSHHRITGWDKHQPSSTRRVKAWRASRKTAPASTSQPHSRIPAREHPDTPAAIAARRARLQHNNTLIIGQPPRPA